jgi:SulP family sulfate permease
VVAPTESGVLHAQPLATAAEALPGLLIYRFTHSMYYANSQQLSEEILNLVKSAEPPLCWFCIDAAGVDDVDYSAEETLLSIYGILKEQGIHLVVSKLMDDVKAEISDGIRQQFGEDAFYDTLEDVVKAYQQQTGADAK